MMSYSKRNAYESIPDLFTQTVLFDLLCICLWKAKGYNELLVMMQFCGDSEYPNLGRVISQVNDFPISYIEFVISPLILENLYYRFNNSTKVAFIKALVISNPNRFL